MDEKTTMGQPLRSMEDEETIDLMELARLLWAHIVQIVAAAVAAALICLLVCMFALTPKYQASINMIVNTRQDNSSTFTSDNFNSAKNLCGHHQGQHRAERGDRHAGSGYDLRQAV